MACLPAAASVSLVAASPDLKEYQAPGGCSQLSGVSARPPAQARMPRAPGVLTHTAQAHAPACGCTCRAAPACACPPRRKTRDRPPPSGYRPVVFCAPDPKGALLSKRSACRHQRLGSWTLQPPLQVWSPRNSANHDLS